VVSVSPLYNDAKTEKPYLDPRIEGDWIMAGPDDTESEEQKPPCKMKIVKNDTEAGVYDISNSCPDRNAERNHGPAYEITKYQVRLVTLNGATFFDSRFVEMQGKDTHFVLTDATDAGMAPTHLIGEVWIEQDFVRFAAFSSEWVDKNWPAEFLVRESVGSRYGDVDVLTNRTDSLRDLVSRSANTSEAFTFPLHLCRPSTDCDKRATDDELARRPNDREVQAGGAKFYEKRGDFARAAETQKHAVELETDTDAKKVEQFQLARVLLLARDFVKARGALASAKEPSEMPSIEDLTVQSYFLEGDYEGAIKAARSVPESLNLRSADPILLSYFAQHRLGNHKGAETYLRQQVADFVGPAEEHLYLLEAVGRVAGGWQGKDFKRSGYYAALGSIRKGDAETGKVQLESVLSMRPVNDLVGVAAKVELERLTLQRN